MHLSRDCDARTLDAETPGADWDAGSRPRSGLPDACGSLVRCDVTRPCRSRSGKSAAPASSADCTASNPCPAGSSRIGRCPHAPPPPPRNASGRPRESRRKKRRTRSRQGREWVACDAGTSTAPRTARGRSSADRRTATRRRVSDQQGSVSPARLVKPDLGRQLGVEPRRRLRCMRLRCPCPWNSSCRWYRSQTSTKDRAPSVYARSGPVQCCRSLRVLSEVGSGRAAPLEQLSPDDGSRT